MGEHLKPVNFTIVPLRVHARRDGQGNSKNQQGQQHSDDKGHFKGLSKSTPGAPESRFIHDPMEKPHDLHPLSREELQEILGKKHP